MGKSFLSSLPSHVLPLNLKDCPAPPVALCHFTLTSLGRTELSLMPLLLAQAPWVLPGTLERLGRVAVYANQHLLEEEYALWSLWAATACVM